MTPDPSPLLRSVGEERSDHYSPGAAGGLAVMAMDSIPPLGVAEVIPVAVSKRDPHAPTPEPNDFATARIPTRPPVKRCGSAERQPKLVFTQRQLTMPTHARPSLTISLEPLPGLITRCLA